MTSVTKQPCSENYDTVPWLVWWELFIALEMVLSYSAMDGLVGTVHSTGDGPILQCNGWSGGNCS